MTSREQNLRVLTEHIDELADRQLKAVDHLLGANRATVDVAHRVTETHGLACAATAFALSLADSERAAAGTALFKRSSELSAKLSTASSNYQNTDYMAGTSLGQACRS